MADEQQIVTQRLRQRANQLREKGDLLSEQKLAEFLGILPSALARVNCNLSYDLAWAHKYLSALYPSRLDDSHMEAY